MAGDANYASVSLLLHGDGANNSTTFTDSSPSPKTVSAVSGAKISTAQSKYGGASILLNGTSDYLTVADSNDWDFGTADFTVELFARFTSHSTIQTLVGNYQGSTIGWAFQRRSDTNALVFGNGDTQLVSASWTPTDGVWYHLAACRSGTSLRLFVDGVQIGSTASNSTNIAGSTKPMLVGALDLSGTKIQFYAGYLDDLRVTKGVARYTSAFTPPTAAHPNHAGEVAGVIKDDTGTNCARTVRIYNRSTGALIAATTSDVTTGAYLLVAPTLDEVQRIVLDDAGGTLYNDLIDRVIPA